MQLESILLSPPLLAVCVVTGALLAYICSRKPANRALTQVIVIGVSGFAILSMMVDIRVTWASGWEDLEEQSTEGRRKALAHQVEISYGELCPAGHEPSTPLREDTCALIGQMVGNQIAVFVHWSALMQALAGEKAPSNVAANNREKLEREMRRLHAQADREHWIARMARRSPGEITWQLFMPALLALGFGGSTGTLGIRARRA